MFEMTEWLHFVDIIVLLLQLLGNQINHSSLKDWSFSVRA